MRKSDQLLEHVAILRELVLSLGKDGMLRLNSEVSVPVPRERDAPAGSTTRKT